jgi:superfamily II DNA or RNA helicase
VHSAPIRPGETVRIRGERWTVTSTGAIVRVRGCDPGNRRVTTAFLTTAERIERLPPPTVRVVRQNHWRRVVRGVLAAAADPDCLLTASGGRLDVLAYQLEPALAVIRGTGVRLLIADEVGLGKTVQAGLIIAETLARTPGAHILVVAPAGLREQWQDELERRFGIASALLSSRTLADSAAAAGFSGNPWLTAGVGVASIDFVKRPEVIRSLEPIVWDLVVFDEAHGLAGRSDRGDAARAIAERARILVMLTATPHAGDDKAFARLTGIGDVDARFPLVVFRRTRADAGLAHRRRTTWLRVRPTAAEHLVHATLLHYATAVWSDRGTIDPAARLAMIVLARRACSSVRSLAQSIERRIALLDARPASEEPPQLMLPLSSGAPDDDAPDDRVLGVAGLSDAAHERQLLAALLDLALSAVASQSKPATLIRLLRRARQPAIVFTEYRDTLEHLAGRLAGFRPVLLHGGLAPSERRASVAAFTRGAAQLLLATDAASEGLNLHDRCRLVVNLELPWTPLRLEQRIGRVERIGQARPVHAVHLIAAGTSEETTVETLTQRMQRAEQVVRTLRPRGIGEQEIAASLFGRPRAAREQAPSLDAGPSPVLHVPDLREAGRVEADRVRRSRALAGARPWPPLLRPVVTGRARGSLPFGACCVYRFVLSDSNQDYVADWVTAFAVDRCASGRDVRATLLAVEDLCRPYVGARAAEVRAEFAARLKHRIDAAMARETAILETITGRRSRLAATLLPSRLLQPGLFDRRSERLADAQHAVVRQASDRCRERLIALRHLAEPAASEPALLFAIVTV